MGRYLELTVVNVFQGPCVGDHLSPVVLKQKDTGFYVAADQRLPKPPINLRAQALADLEDS
jgi:hypothetical protein